MKPLMDELSEKIVTILNLSNVRPEEIDPDEQLVGGRLEIDSIDVLEMVMMMEKDYQITIDNKEIGAVVFQSIRTMAEHIKVQEKKACA